MTLLQQKDSNQVEELFKESMIVETNRIQHSSFDEVFAKPVYEIRYSFFNSSPSENSPSRKVFVSDDKLIRIVEPATNTTLDFMDELIDPDFQIDGQSIQTLKSALKNLLPSRFDEDEMVEVEEAEGVLVTQDDNSWYIYKGIFFDNISGFEIQVNENDEITKVEQVLKIKEID